MIAFSVSACSEKERADIDITKLREIDVADLNVEQLTEVGKEIFYMKASNNNISCADCHSDGTNDDRPLTKYFSNIRGANKRPATYHGKFTGEEVHENAGGATVCWDAYMKYKSRLTKAQVKVLNAYFESLITSDEDLEEVVYNTIALPERDKRKLRDEQEKIIALTGNIDVGRELFKHSCAFCHAPDSEIGKVPSLKDDFEGNIKGVVFMTRLGDGAMPFYRYDKLSDQQIADLSAFIMSLKE